LGSLIEKPIVPPLARVASLPSMGLETRPDPDIADGTLQLRVPDQRLHRSQVAGLLVNLNRLHEDPFQGSARSERSFSLLYLITRHWGNYSQLA
jgi:hypothetical protein